MEAHATWPVLTLLNYCCNQFTMLLRAAQVPKHVAYWSVSMSDSMLVATVKHVQAESIGRHNPLCKPPCPSQHHWLAAVAKLSFASAYDRCLIQLIVQ
jgi:hypothetical protein